MQMLMKLHLDDIITCRSICPSIHDSFDFAVIYAHALYFKMCSLISVVLYIRCVYIYIYIYIYIYVQRKRERER